MEHVGDELRPGFGWVSLVSRDESSVLGVVGVSTSTVFVTVDTIVVNAASAGVVVASGAAEEQPDANVTAAIGRTAKRLISSPVIAAFLPSVSAGNPKRTSSPRSGTRRVPHPRASITRRWVAGDGNHPQCGRFSPKVETPFTAARAGQASTPDHCHRRMVGVGIATVLHGGDASPTTIDGVQKTRADADA